MTPTIAEEHATTRRWALLFCARCVERAAPMLPEDGPEFPAWEILSELSRLHAVLHGGEAPSPTVDEAWAADCTEWCGALREAALVVSRKCPAQAREFALLASCAGSPLPEPFERMLAEQVPALGG